MCTLTIIPVRSGVRLMINRDELLTRPAARPPSLLELESGRRALCPTDARAGGTWIALNDSGLMLALLNGNPRPMPPLPPKSQLRSRGLIIPALIDVSSPADALAKLDGIELARVAPFRLVAAASDAILDAVWDRAGLRIAEREMMPTCFVSSGLGDHRVPPRIDLFNEWTGGQPWTAAAQDEFHRHRWPDRPEVSVMMCREGARTVSITTIEAPFDAPPTMRYADDAGERSISFDGPRHPVMNEHRNPTALGSRAPC